MHNDAGVPNVPFANFVTSYSTTDLRNGKRLVVNFTAPESFFNPGYVAREIVEGVVHTYGEGTSLAQSALADWLITNTASLSGLVTVDYINDAIWGTQMQTFIDRNATECACN
jgi:hypothetical protein